MVRRLRLMVLVSLVALSGCELFGPQSTPANRSPDFTPKSTARPTATVAPQVFGPFFDSQAPPDDSCRRQTGSWGNEVGDWVIGPSYCTYWPSDNTYLEAFSLCVGEWQDVTIEANLRYYTLPSRVGIVVRALHPNDALVFVLSQDGEGAAYWQVRQGSEDDPVDAPELWSEPIDRHTIALPRGNGQQVVIARVQINAIGDRLEATVNGLDAGVLENAPVRSGRVGLYMYNNGVEQSWADVTIRAR